MKFWKIYPVRPIKGFTVTYIPVKDSGFGIEAATECLKMEKYSGVKWTAKQVER